MPNIGKIADIRAKELKTTPLALKLRNLTRPRNPLGAEKLRVVDLFAGCGGLTLGAFQAARDLAMPLEIAFAIDINRPAVEVYKSNFSDISRRIELRGVEEFIECDMFSRLNANGRLLIKEIGRVDVLLAGPPCQGNSDLNNSSRRNDPRNDLYLAAVLFAEELKSSLVIIENVPGVIHAESNVVQRSIERITRVGYTCCQVRTDLTGFGLPQTRKRHLLVASRLHTGKELNEQLTAIATTSNSIQLWDFISDLEDSPRVSNDIFNTAARMSETNVQRIDYLFDNELYDLPNSMRPPCHREKQHSYVSMYGRMRADAPAQTITSGFGSMGQGRFVHPTRRRTITPHEAARIQGFPDYFDFGDIAAVTQLRQMIGNAVAPVLSQVVIRNLMK